MSCLRLFFPLDKVQLSYALILLPSALPAAFRAESSVLHYY